MEALAAGIVGLALLWLVAQPMLFPAAVMADPIEPMDAEETPRGRALLALKEIEFDRATGKLSDEDFSELHSKYSAEAIAVLNSESAALTSVPSDDAIESLISARVAALTVDPMAPHDVAGPRCLAHGTIEADGACFCPACGCGLLSTVGTCLQCGGLVPTDANFCPGCAVPVRR